ncbi:MAG: hypothetical protein CR982_08915 [Candidatus Cloacimonadota bacterium]|nr:MAG: hypothetical protein CR982_08915 [Candidatus Cloacimonadota bacterium]PIE78973.1 MAG: hypothetical protein CSA15_05090 [Candidatus Delongbacteria bacterium]
MKKNIIRFLLLILTMSSLLILSDFLFSLYKDSFYFKLSNKNILPALGYSLLTFLITSRVWRNIAIGTIFFGSLLQFWFYQYFGDYFQAIAFIQFFNNLYEVYDSVLPILLSFLPPLIIVIFCSGLTIFISNRYYKEGFKFKFSSYLIIIALLGNLLQTYIYIEGIGSDGKLAHWKSRALYPNKRELSVFNFHKSLNYLLVGIIPKKIFGSSFNFPVLDPPKKVSSVENNIVFVLGESLRYDRLSLFGYDKETTPKLDSLANIGKIDFKYIYSGGTMTKTSSAVILNRIKYPGMEQMVNKDNNLFKLAKDNGYNTAFISAQTGKSMSILESLIGIKNVDFYIHRDKFDKDHSCCTGCDEDIFPYLESIDLSKKNFIIIQQRGSHSPYNKYTEKFNLFNDKYDNTVVYTDYFLNKVYRYLEENSKLPTYFIFASDHGELLGEKGKNGHGWFEKEVYRVPMVSTSFNTDKNIDIKTIDTHFELSNYLTKLLGYETKYKREEDRDIYVNGSDLDGLAGYMKIKMKGDSAISKEIIK